MLWSALAKTGTLCFWFLRPLRNAEGDEVSRLDRCQVPPSESLASSDWSRAFDKQQVTSILDLGQATRTVPSPELSACHCIRSAFFHPHQSCT